MRLENLVNKYVLVTVGDNDAIRSTGIKEISPNRLYCLLNSDRSKDESIGWVRCSDVTILDVLGDF